MRLRIDPATGGVLLTIPKRQSHARALRWAEGQQAWIEAALAGLPAAMPIEADGEIPYRGELCRIGWRADRPRRVLAVPGRLEIGGPLDGLEARLLRWLKGEARRLLDLETREFAAKAGVTVSRVGVGDPVSRWGSCSSSGAIRYSWRLILAPDWVRRATVAHEVAHRVHMDHSARFHALVETLLGADPAPARRWLRREGAMLQRVGRSR